MIGRNNGAIISNKRLTHRSNYMKSNSRVNVLSILKSTDGKTK
jgi:hypothetical protein